MPTLDLLSLSGSINLQGSLTGSVQGTASLSNRSLAADKIKTVNVGGFGTYYPLLGGSFFGDVNTYTVESPAYKYNLGINQLQVFSISSSFTGSLQGTAATASYWSGSIVNAQSASFATSASVAISASWAPTPAPAYREYVATIEYSGVSGFYITQMANTIGDGSNTAGNDITWSVVGNGVLWAEMNDAFIGNVQINPCIFLASANDLYFMVGEVWTTGILQFNIKKYDNTQSSTPSFYTTVSIKVYN